MKQLDAREAGLSTSSQLFGVNMPLLPQSKTI
jgi:hypothetical protein